MLAICHQHVETDRSGPGGLAVFARHQQQESPKPTRVVLLSLPPEERAGHENLPRLHDERLFLCRPLAFRVRHQLDKGADLMRGLYIEPKLEAVVVLPIQIVEMPLAGKPDKFARGDLPAGYVTGVLLRDRREVFHPARSSAPNGFSSAGLPADTFDRAAGVRPNSARRDCA